MSDEFTLTYVNIGMPCESRVCKTNKDTWFILAQIRDDRCRQIMICDDCAFLFQTDNGIKIYQEMVDYTKKMSFDWPNDWVPIKERELSK